MQARTLLFWTLAAAVLLRAPSAEAGGCACRVEPRPEVSFRDISAALVRCGCWPEPRAARIGAFDIEAAARNLGLAPAPGPRPQDPAVSLWRTRPGEAGSWHVRLHVYVGKDGPDARAKLLRDLICSTAPVPVASGETPRQVERPPQLAGGAYTTLLVMAERPRAGEICTVPEHEGARLLWTAFVQHNVAIRVTARPVAAEGEPPSDAATSDTAAALAEGLDRILLAAAPGPPDPAPPAPRVVIEAVLLELPVPRVGQPFLVVAETTVVGQAPGQAQPRLDWEIAHKHSAAEGEPPRELHREAVSPSEMRFIVGKPGLWSLTCRASLGRAVPAEATVPVYVLPALQTPAP